MLAQGIGAVIVKLPNSAKAVLELVLYIPELQLNLVSLSRLMQKGAKISFAERYIDILLKSGAKLQANADAQGLFYVPFSADFQFALITAEPPMDQLWHQRFGHIGATALDKIPDLVISISEKDTGYAPKNPCEACIKGKFIANPNHSAVETHYTEYRNYISSDLYRPISKTAY